MQNPNELTDFENILTAYNEYVGLNIIFEEHWTNPDILCIQQHTADDYAIWTLLEGNDNPNISDDVFYNEPAPKELFNYISYSIGRSKVDVVVYTELDMKDLEEYMLNTLLNSYESHLARNEAVKA